MHILDFIILDLMKQFVFLLMHTGAILNNGEIEIETHISLNQK
jgi:hypothetical protein